MSDRPLAMSEHSHPYPTRTKGPSHTDWAIVIHTAWQSFQHGALPRLAVPSASRAPGRTPAAVRRRAMPPRLRKPQGGGVPGRGRRCWRRGGCATAPCKKKGALHACIIVCSRVALRQAPRLARCSPGPWAPAPAPGAPSSMDS